MKKIVLSCLVLCLLSIGVIPSFGGASLVGPKQTPENVKCPDGVWRSHCVDHE
jgi:hypothetical protein